MCYVHPPLCAHAGAEEVQLDDVPSQIWFDSPGDDLHKLSMPCVFGAYE